jgi:hypothetical protein
MNYAGGGILTFRNSVVCVSCLLYREWRSDCNVRGRMLVCMATSANGGMLTFSSVWVKSGSLGGCLFYLSRFPRRHATQG